MTQPLYTQQALEALECKEVKVIAKSLGIAPKFRKAAVIAQVIAHQKEQVRQVGAGASTVSHCRQCPFFSANHPGSERGWCHAFNAFAKGSHPATDTCQLEIAAQTPKVPPADPEEMPIEIACTVAYPNEKVKTVIVSRVATTPTGILYTTIGNHSIEFVSNGGYWYAGDGVKYPEPSQALTSAFSVWDGLIPVGLEDLPKKKELVFTGECLEF